MGSKKDNRPYIPKNMEYFGQYLAQIQAERQKEKEHKVDVAGLEKAVRALPKEARKRVENYWGLTGGINHSKRLRSLETNDQALLNMSNEALEAITTLFRIDYMYMYDLNLQKMVQILSKKIAKNGLDASDLEAVKYLEAFTIFLSNGPKLSFETDPMVIDTTCNPDYLFDEYSLVKEAVQELQKIPDNSIQLKLIRDFLDMLDLQDGLAIKKTFNIAVPVEDTPSKMQRAEIPAICTLRDIRDFKERVFPYGRWEVTEALILGGMKDEETPKIDEFMECLDTIRRDWSKISEFKDGQKLIRTFRRSRALQMYNIGGLRFSDPYEVMFLYVERNLLIATGG